MEDEAQDSTSSNQSCERNQPVRSRWNPKPEQILILESIFNSGMVNPPKDETVRIRKILEQFGAVGDANVFYWFQNRRSRSRRRQRQIQASLSAASDNSGGGGELSATSSRGGAIQFYTSTGNSGPMAAPSSYLVLGSSSSSSSSSCGGVVGNANDGSDGLLPFSDQMGLPKIEQNSSVTSILCSPANNANLHYQTGFITVFINGVATEVPRGPLDMKAMFGPENLVLYHSSGLPLPVNEYGFIVESLQHGESYFLVLTLLYARYSNSRISLVLQIECTLRHLRLNFAVGDENDQKVVVEAIVVAVASQVGLAGAIPPPPLAGTSNFNITSIILHLVGMKRLFSGLAHQDPKKHLKDFVGVELKYNILGISQKGI